MLYTLLGKIINTSIGRSKYRAAVAGLGMAFLLILCATQLHYTFRYINKHSNTGSDEYLVVSKKVSTDMIGDLGKTTFSPAEIAEVKKQPFFDTVGVMVSNRFRVRMKIHSNSLPLESEMYFEAVPDEFLDIKPANWSWQPGQQVVPGIAPRMLLDLYNFGFAIGQNLPQVSEESVKMLPLEFTITGADGRELKVMGRVAGFSDRINTILIPMSFMQWANDNYGFKQPVPPGRLIVHTKNPTASELTDFFKKMKLDTNAGVTRFSRVQGAVTLMVKLLSIIGVLLFAFALVVFTLFVQLTIAAARQQVQLLVTLGASPQQLGRFLMKKIFPPYAITAVVALAIVMAGLYWVAHLRFFTSQNVRIHPWVAPGTVIVTALLLGTIWLINRRAIGRNLKGVGQAAGQ